MSQVKKLQDGGTAPIKNKIIFNGKEYTEDELNLVANTTGKWFKENSNYSSDVSEVSSLIDQIKNELKSGKEGKSDTTGTSLAIGDTVYSSAGKTNQNIFGNWSDKKLGSALSEKITDAFKQVDNQKNTQTSTTSTPAGPKTHYDLSKTLSERYYGGNWENTQKGIGELTPDQRLAYAKEGLKDVINSYRIKYNEDSPYLSKLKDIDTADATKLKEIAYSLGQDVSPYLEGTPEQQAEKGRKEREQNPFYELAQHGEVIDDDYLKYRNLIALKDKITGKVRMFDRNDFTKEFGQESSGVVETDYSDYYGKGMFYDPNEGWKWGNKEELAQGNLYNPVTLKYKELYDSRKTSPTTINFKDTYDPVLTGLRDRNTNTLNYNDISDHFSNLGGNRIIVKDPEYNVLGDIDLKKSKLYYYDKTNNSMSLVDIDLSTNGPAIARSIKTGKSFDLGAFRKGINNVPELGTTYSTVIGSPDDLNDNLFRRSITKVVGFENKEITPDNVLDFYQQVIRKNFKGDIDPNDAKNLANTILKIYNDPKFKVKTALSPNALNALKAVIAELGNAKSAVKTFRSRYSTPDRDKTVNEQLTLLYKKGGVLKKQAGGGIQIKKVEHTPVAKVKSPTMGYGSARIGDYKTFSTADTFDSIAVSADIASLAGGAFGIGAGLVGTGAQFIGDIAGKRGASTTISNVLINLGFTAMAAIPGLAALKMAKGAKNVGKLAKNVNEIKRAEKLLEVAKKSNIDDVSKLAKKLQDEIKVVKKVAGENPNAASKLVQSISNSKTANWIAPKVQGGLVVGGLISGYSGLSNAIEDDGNMRLSDLRNITGGIAALKGLGSMAKNQLIKSGTTKLSEIKAEPYKVKTKDGEIIELPSIPKGVKDAEKQVKAHYDSKILKIKEEIKTVDPVDTKRINELEESIKNLETKKTDAEVGNFLGYKSGKLLVDDLKSKIKIKSQNKNWDDRRLKTDDEITGWSSRVGQNLAKKAGYSNEGFTVQGNNLINKMYEKPFTTQKKAIDKLNSDKIDNSIEELRTLNKNLLSELKKNRPVKPTKEVVKSKRKYTKKEKSKVENKPEIKKMLALPVGKFYNAKQKLGMSSNSNSMHEMAGKPKVDRYGQLSMFKQGGQLISKFQNSGELKKSKLTLQDNPTSLNNLNFLENSNLEFKNKLGKIWNTDSAFYTDYETISGEKIPVNKMKLTKSLPTGTVSKLNTTSITPTTLTTPTVNATGDSVKQIPGWGKYENWWDKINIDKRVPSTLAQYLNTRAVNRDVAKRLASVKPVLQQTPTEVYKPVVTNLANENFVNNQVTSYLNQASKPITSDASLQKAMQLEAMSKVTPLQIQARSANTDMYNQTLGASKDSAEKYGLMRNEVANSNLERLGAHDARIATIYATKRRMDGESTDNLLKRLEGFSEENRKYKQGFNSAMEADKLQKEYSTELKPFSEKYTKLSDPTEGYKYSEAYKRYLVDSKKPWSEYKEGGISGSDIASKELKAAQDAYEKESERLLSFYKPKLLSLQYQNPNYYKSGGTVDTKVEIQNLKNKMKAKEIDAKYKNEVMNRKQKEVLGILKGMSKESLFLLKTMLGK